LLTTGCNKAANTDLNYKTALNDHFRAFPTCIWSEPKKFPVQAATSDDSKTEGYDALTQEGLLTRTTAEKKVLIIASKQVNNYDLSDKGRTSWTRDSSQPGYGNFCYGSREVTSIDDVRLGQAYERTNLRRGSRSTDHRMNFRSIQCGSQSRLKFRSRHI
jgi:hypothetical protein